MPTDVLISVVDDDESLRKALARLITSVGLDVEEFASAEDFLSSDGWQTSTCLILDVRLSGMSGLELQSRLVPFARRIPIIFMSGNGDGEERAQALEAGAIDFLQKPFSEEALFNALQSALGIEHARLSPRAAH